MICLTHRWLQRTFYWHFRTYKEGSRNESFDSKNKKASCRIDRKQSENICIALDAVCQRSERMAEILKNLNALL